MFWQNFLLPLYNYSYIMIDRATVDRIYAAANIVDIIGDYVTLKKKGVNYQACCPFHNEKTPSDVVRVEMPSPSLWSTRVSAIPRR